MKQTYLTTLLLITLSVQLYQAVDIKHGVFTPFKLAALTDTIKYTGQLDLTTATEDQRIYFNFQNTNLYDGLNYAIKNGTLDIDNGTVQKTSRAAFQLASFICAKPNKCDYSIEFSYKQGSTISANDLGQVQIIQQSSTKNIPNKGDFTVYPQLKLKIAGITDFPRLAQNVIAPDGTQDGTLLQVSYEYLIKLEDFQLQKYGYAAVMNNGLDGTDMNLAVSAQTIEAGDIEKSSQWPSLTTDYSQNYNAQILPNIADINQGYIAVSVFVQIASYDQNKDYSFIAQFNQLKQTQVDKLQIDVTTNKLIHGIQTDRINNPYKITAFVTHKETTDKYTQFSVFSSQKPDTTVKVDKIIDYSVTGKHRQLDQFIDLNANKDSQYYFVSFTSPLLAVQQTRLSYTIDPENLLDVTDKTDFSYDKITENFQELMFYKVFNLKGQDNILDQFVRFKINSNLDQTKLTVSHKFVDGKSADDKDIPSNFDNSQTYNDMNNYSPSDTTSKVLKLLKVQQHLIGTQTTTYLIIKIQRAIGDKIDNQNLYFQLQTQEQQDLKYLYKQYYLSKMFFTQYIEQNLTKTFFDSKSGVISASNDLYQTDIKYTVTLGNKNYDAVTINHDIYNQQYPIANILDTDITAQCTGDTCNFKIEIQALNIDTANEQQTDKPSTNLVLRFQQNQIWNLINSPYGSQSQLITKLTDTLQVFKYKTFSQKKNGQTFVSVSTKDFSQTNQIYTQKVSDENATPLTQQQFDTKISKQSFAYNDVLVLDYQCQQDPCQQFFYVYYNFKTSAQDQQNAFFINTQTQISSSQLAPNADDKTQKLNAKYRPIQDLTTTTLNTDTTTTYDFKKTFVFKYSLGVAEKATENIGEFSSVYLYGYNTDNTKFEKIKSFSNLQDLQTYKFANPDKKYLFNVLSNPIFRNEYSKYNFASVEDTKDLAIGKHTETTDKAKANIQYLIDLSKFNQNDLTIKFAQKKNVKLAQIKYKNMKNMIFPNPIGDSFYPANANIHDFQNDKVFTVSFDKTKVDQILLDFYFEAKGTYKFDVIDGKFTDTQPKSLLPGIFTPFKHTDEDQIIEFTGSLDLSPSSEDQMIYFNIQNPYLFDGLQYLVKNGNDNVGNGDVQKIRSAYNLEKITCIKKTKCDYSIQFSLKSGTTISTNPSSQVQIIQKSSKKQTTTGKSYIEIPNLSLKVEGITDIPRLAQNVIVPDDAEQDGQYQASYQYLVKLEDFQLQKNGYAAVLNNGKDDTNLNLTISAQTIKDADKSDSSKWPVPSLDFSENSNTIILPNTDDLSKGYIAVTVFAQIAKYDTNKKYSFIVQFAQLSQETLAEQQIDLNTNKLIHGSQTERIADPYKITSFLTHSEQEEIYSSFIVYSSQKSDTAIKVSRITDYSIKGKQKALSQFIDLNADKNSQHYFISFANPGLQKTQTLSISYTINPENIIDATNQPQISYKKITEGDQELLFYQVYNLEAQTTTFDISLRLLVNTKLDQTKLAVTHQFVDEKSVKDKKIPSDFGNSQTYNDLDNYYSDTTSKKIQIKDVKSKLIGTQTTTYLMVRVKGDFTQVINEQDLYFQLLTSEPQDLHYLYKQYYLTKQFTIQYIEQSLNKTFFDSKSGVISASNDLYQTDIKYTVTLGAKVYDAVTIKHTDYNQQYPIANIPNADITAQCTGDTCDFKIKIEALSIATTNELQNSKPSTNLVLRFQQDSTWNLINSPYGSQSQLITKQQDQLQIFKYKTFTKNKFDQTFVSVSTKDFSQTNQIYIQKVADDKATVLTPEQFEDKIKEQPFSYNDVLAFDSCQQDSCEHFFYVYYNFKTSNKENQNAFFINTQSSQTSSKLAPDANTQGEKLNAKYRPIQDLTTTTLNTNASITYDAKKQFVFKYSLGAEEKAKQKAGGGKLSSVFLGAASNNTQNVTNTVQKNVGELSSLYLYGYNANKTNFELIQSFNNLEDLQTYQFANPDRIYLFNVLSNPMFRQEYSKYNFANVEDTTDLKIGAQNITTDKGNQQNLIDLSQFQGKDFSIKFAEKKNIKLAYNQYKKQRNMKFPNPIGDAFYKENANTHDFSKENVFTLPIDKTKADYLLLDFYYGEQGTYSYDLVDGKKQKKGSGSNSTLWIIIGSIVGAIIIIGVIIFIVYKKKKQKEKLKSSYRQPLKQSDYDIEK